MLSVKNFNRTLLIITLMLLCFSLSAEEPFEPGERRIQFAEKKEESLTDNLMDFYQNVLSANSISRCPFHTSCSHFAQQQVETRGWLVGSLYFIDRYFFRENRGIHRLYPIVLNKEGEPKLNDDFYLEP
jgi:hypothetical protein